MGQMSVKELYEALGRLAAEGYGDRKIVVADDEEGNGYHGLFHSVYPLEDDFEGRAVAKLLWDSEETDITKLVTLG